MCAQSVTLFDTHFVQFTSQVSRLSEKKKPWMKGIILKDECRLRIIIKTRVYCNVFIFIRIRCVRVVVVIVVIFFFSRDDLSRFSFVIHFKKSNALVSLLTFNVECYWNQQAIRCHIRRHRVHFIPEIDWIITHLMHKPVWQDRCFLWFHWLLLRQAVRNKHANAHHVNSSSFEINE